MAGPLGLDTAGYTGLALGVMRLLNTILPYANLVGKDGEAFETELAAIMSSQKQRSQAILDREAAHDQQMADTLHVEVPTKPTAPNDKVQAEEKSKATNEKK